MARSAGIEPTTHCLEGSCSIQLSYERNRSAANFQRLLARGVTAEILFARLGLSGKPIRQGQSGGASQAHTVRPSDLLVTIPTAPSRG